MFRVLVVSGLSFSCVGARSRALFTRAESSVPSDVYDLGIVGGGIVGLATARELKMRFPRLKVILFEKEKELALHQTGHNSGVIHAGIYYTPGSLKAKLCVEGARLTFAYCDEKKIPYQKCGKLIVAVEPEEIPRLEILYKRGQENGVPNLKYLTTLEEIKQIEPNCVGLAAIHSPETAIVDWGLVARTYGEDFKKLGGEIKLEHEVVDFTSPGSGEKDFSAGVSVHAKVGSDTKQYNCKYVITCGGLYSDRLAEKSGCSSDPKIVPFRGEYLLLKPEKANLVRGNIYPVNDPRFPFLGVHFTPRIDGQVWLGPNAVFAFAREGYSYFDIRFSDIKDAIFYSGFLALAQKFFTFGVKETFRSIFIFAQVRQLQRFVPSLQYSDVERGPSGVRAQALNPDGSLVDDFIFDSGTASAQGRLLHVRNAPSPAATSSLSIAKMVADKATQEFKLSK